MGERRSLRCALPQNLRLAHRRAATGAPLPRAPGEERGPEETGLFPGRAVGGGRDTAPQRSPATGSARESSPRCAPSAPAQLRRDLRGFDTGDRAGPARTEQEPFREQGY